MRWGCRDGSDEISGARDRSWTFDRGIPTGSAVGARTSLYIKVRPHRSLCVAAACMCAVFAAGPLLRARPPSLLTVALLLPSSASRPRAGCSRHFQKQETSCARTDRPIAGYNVTSHGGPRHAVHSCQRARRQATTSNRHGLHLPVVCFSVSVLSFCSLRLQSTAEGWHFALPPGTSCYYCCS